MWAVTWSAGRGRLCGRGSGVVLRGLRLGLGGFAFACLAGVGLDVVKREWKGSRRGGEARWVAGYTNVCGTWLDGWGLVA